MAHAIAGGDDVEQVHQLWPDNLPYERVAIGGDVAHRDLHVFGIRVFLGSGGFILTQQDGIVVALRTRSERLQRHGALKDERLGGAVPTNLDAKLGAQVGHGGGGSADDKEGKGEEGRGIFDLGFLICDLQPPPLPPSPLPLLQFPRQLPNRQIPAIRLHLIRHRPLQDDLGPGVVGDFHQAGGKGELVAESDKGFGIRDLR